MERKHKKRFSGVFSIAGLWATIIFFALLQGIIFPSEAQAWWDGKWGARVQIKLDASPAGANIRENLTDVPVLVRLHLGNFNFSDARADGSDLRFVDSDDKTPLKYHIEKFDPVEEIALVWVRLPRLVGGSDQTSFWMYYKNDSAIDAQDAPGTYDVNTVAVFHFSEPEGLPQDKTAYKNAAAKFSGQPGLPSIIGLGASFSGEGESMTIIESPSLNFNKGFAFSAWIRLQRPSPASHILSWDDGTQHIIIGADGAQLYCRVASARGIDEITPKTVSLTPGQWRHVGVSIDDRNRVTVYLDGDEVISAKIKGAMPAPKADIILGNSAAGKNLFAGDIDEVQLSNTARVGDWMRAAFQSQGPEGRLVSLMEAQAGGDGDVSMALQLLKVVVRTISVDGWIIIGILFCMGAASAVVFTQKVITIRNCARANDRFSKQFKQAPDPLKLSQTAEEGDFEDAPLYRLYESGSEEIALWSKRTRGGESLREGRGISGVAMSGFKAALDKAMMKESRELNRGMFVLNTSLGGGPFLGLLGTVWGVMNTFAGLALAGEANLTAIAPGVASALATTVAGLLVAIPALFATIYLASRIKDMIADMEIFSDEFVLRMEDEVEDKP